MGDKNNFYVMDDDYIEQKYVKAEEDRQRLEQEQKRQREIDEANALAEAERKRKAADEERRRRQEEADRMQALENARKHREEVDRIRVTKQKEYEEKIKKIEDELKAIEERKAAFVTDKINMTTSHNEEEAQLRKNLDDIVEQKRIILDKELTAKADLDAFQSKSKAQALAMDHEQQQAAEKQRALNLERRNIQNEMLAFLQNPEAEITKPQETSVLPSINQAPPQTFPSMQPMQHSLPPTHSQPQPQTNYPSMPNYQSIMNPNQQPPQANMFNSNMGGGFQAPAPFQQSVAPPMQQVQQPVMQKPTPTPKNDGPPTSDLNDQLGMLDDLLAQGIMTKDEYEVNKKEALRAAGITDTGPPKGNDPSSDPAVAQQLAQLNAYLRDGVLQQADYEDAKKRVLEDAAKKGGSNPAAQPPVAQVAPRNTQVAVVVPAGKKTGDLITISYQGKNYNIKIPPGIYAGQQFYAAIPI